MLSALKKLTTKQDAVSVPPNTAGQPMSGSLQKKFSKGVNYNMKIIIKGDRNVGKSCLLQRLQGGGFIETYTPTEQIQVASIQWSFKATEDIVKVEVWDVVDRGKARPRNTGLKLTTGSSSSSNNNGGSSSVGFPEQPALDAEFLDVYKGTHGVILMMDITKSWTFDYVTRELPKVPLEIPVLILGNHCDMGHHRVISPEQVTALIENLRENRSAEILYAESSMRNGFGLRLLHKFLGLPFLRLQKETLLGLIERNKHDTEICEFEIAEFLKSDDSDYNKFLNNLSNKRRQIAESNSRVPSAPLSSSSSSSSVQHSNSATLSHSTSNSLISSSIHQKYSGNNSTLPSGLSTTTQELRPTKSIIVGGGQPIIIPGQVNITQQIKQQQQLQQQNNNNKNCKIGEEGTLPSSSSTSSALSLDIPQKDLVTALLQKSCTTNNGNSNKYQINDKRNQLKIDEQKKIISVEEFCPDEGVLDRSFLDDIGTSSSSTTTTTMVFNQNNDTNDDDDDDDDNLNEGNPMVAKFNDEPDTDINNDHEKIISNDIKNIKISNDKIKINPLLKNRHQYNQNNSLLDNNNLMKLLNNQYSLSNDEINETDTTIIIPTTTATTTTAAVTSTNYESSSSPLPSYDDNLSSDNNYSISSSSWLINTKETLIRRQSPEGGEDITILPNNNQDSLIQKKKHQENTSNNNDSNDTIDIGDNDNDDDDNDDNDDDNHRKHRHRHSTEKKSNSSKHKKHKKDKNKDKDETKREKKKKRHHHHHHSKETDLEEFLNGPATIIDRIDEAYEAI